MKNLVWNIDNLDRSYQGLELIKVWSCEMMMQSSSFSKHPMMMMMMMMMKSCLGITKYERVCLTWTQQLCAQTSRAIN